MPNITNPFDYDGAPSFDKKYIADTYVEEYSYTRFIRSPRNVFLIGERGSGKSITLIYNSVQVQQLVESRRGEVGVDVSTNLNFVGVYFQCNTPLTQKREHELLTKAYHSSVISEHFLVMSLVEQLVSTVQQIPAIEGQIDNTACTQELEYITGQPLPEGKPFLEAVKLFALRELASSQHFMVDDPEEKTYPHPLTFSSIISPIIKLLKRTERLKSSHFLLMVDDAQSLNEHQQKILNSWIAYRDRSDFSFKVAIADTASYSLITQSGGAILEGHDYIAIEFEKPFQSSGTPFDQLAKKIIEKRLKLIGIENPNVEEFFPANRQFLKDLEECNTEIREEALKLFGDHPKKVRDYVYKFGRVKYFRSRDVKANLPPYSGWGTIVHVSTGIVRNLLYPCFYMYDRATSENGSSAQGSPSVVRSIPPDVQSEVLKERSRMRWETMVDELARSIDGCSEEQANQIFRLFDNLAVLFKDRLRNHRSEPRAIVFTISAMSEEERSTLVPLLEIARKAQLLYYRSGPSKDDGRRERYYVPNRLLWPIRGLDVEGQHARVSLKASDLMAAARGQPFPPVGAGAVGSEQEEIEFPYEAS